MNFEFATATRIIFGEGKREELRGMVPKLGRRVLVVQGRDKGGRLDWLRKILADCRMDYSTMQAAGEPSIELVEAGAREARERGCEMLIGVGGGSAIDAGKAIAALATNTAPAMEYLEVIGKGKPLSQAPLPFIAVPTTAGTGAEVTRNAVLFSAEHRVKVSLRSPRMLPAVALVDPELTYDLPPDLTVSTGLDALTQLIEPFVCTRANPMTDALCRQALPLVMRALPVAFQNGGNKEARREMALGSLFGGLALANAGLGAVHGFAAPIGGMFDAAHGAVCAALLPAVMQVNLRAVASRGSHSTIERFNELGRLLTGNADADGSAAVRTVEKLTSELQVARLGAFGIGAEHFDLLCERAASASSMKANPVELTRNEQREILERSL